MLFPLTYIELHVVSVNRQWITCCIR